MAPMRQPLIRQGESLDAALDRLRRERESLRRKLDEIANTPELAPELDSRRRGRGTAAGDRDKLRGIPAAGRSVGGAMRGTDPQAETMRRLGNWSGRNS